MRYKIFLTLLVLLLTTNLFAQAKKIDEKQISFSVPHAPFYFILNGENFEISQQKIKPDAKYGYFFIENKKTNVLVSLFIEPVEKCKTSKECRDMVWKAGNPAWGKPKM